MSFYITIIKERRDETKTNIQILFLNGEELGMENHIAFCPLSLVDIQHQFNTIVLCTLEAWVTIQITEFFILINTFNCRFPWEQLCKEHT